MWIYRCGFILVSGDRDCNLYTGECTVKAGISIPFAHLPVRGLCVSVCVCVAPQRVFAIN